MTVRDMRRRLAMGLTHGWLSQGERHALPATAGWKRARFIELVKTVEIGPFTYGREPNVTIVAKIYKDLKKKAFFPIVFRRGSYRITPGFANRPAYKQVDVIDPGFVPEDFLRANEAAALADVVREIRRRLL